MHSYKNKKEDKTVTRRKVTRKKPNSTRSKGIICEVFGDNIYSGGSILTLSDSGKSRRKSPYSNSSSGGGE